MKIRIQPGARNRAQRRSAGVALITVLVALTSLMVMVAVFHQRCTRIATESRVSLDDARAFYLADTALSEAMVAVRAGSTGGIGSQAAPAYFGGGVLWVQATPMGANRTRLLATALCGSGRAAVEAVVEMTSQEPLFQAVLNSKEQLTLNADCVVDSFESKLGSYASQVASSYNGLNYAKDNGDVLSNAGIVLNSRATVFGDAVPGPGYGVSFATGSYVSGSTAPSPVTFDFPPIVVPPVASSGPLTLPDGTSQTLPAGTHGFDQLNIGKDANLTVQGPASLVCTDFTGGRLGRITVDATNGPVTLYVQGKYTHMSGFEAVSAPGSPLALAFMISATQDITFPASTKLRGGYYAPNSNITFTNKEEIWGAFAANRIDMSSTTHFHFDESLSEYWEHDGGSYKDPLDVLVWRRANVQPDVLLRDRRDPDTVLGVQSSALPSPAQSWL